MAFREFMGNLKRSAPDILRAGLVAAANPTRGAVGTAGDIFGAIGAVDEDRQRRIAQQREQERQILAVQRQAEEDERAAQLNEARIEEARTQAEYNTRRGTQQQGKGVPPTKLQIYKEAFDHFKGQGLSNEDAHVEARSIALGTASPELYNKRTPASDAAQMNRELDRWRNDPNLQQQYPSFDEYYRSIGIGAAKADTASQVTTSKKKAEAPFSRPFAFQTEGGAKLVRPGFLGGKMEEQNVQFTPRKPEPRQATASDERFDRDKTISRIVNRVLNEEKSGTGNPANALRNVQQFYSGDPEVQQYKAEVMARLQKLVQGQGTSKKAEGFVEVQDAAKQRREKRASMNAPAKPAGSAVVVEKWVMDASGNLVRAK